ncbi:MAG: TRCF domain-containing protein, partial [Thermodesulfobacteriota bacterium]|nr:TRCF domain-containing protein [Thermodesulfobacteriota bacterium]
MLKIYAARKVHHGFAFSAPAGGYQTFTALFAFEETPDQQQAIEDVMADMAKPVPMDRLVCGDVGYGKTEVALRAAYMVAENAKQVAMVVPTTILAEQHFSTFSARFKRTPFNVACLSRFRSAQHQKEIVSRLKSGGIDIVIGTHRLFSKDVEFKDLGLVILDEEQRFGVKHKEKLKRVRTTVDVLALTATPIPRTLHLSMTGVRDISIISTPPEYRQAIVTYVCEYDEAVIRDAIRKELERGGQIYFVHNDIASIERMARRIKQLVPDVRMDIAHGRMKEENLENTMYRFKKGEVDMLVCTTIIESGLDVPAANTMIVNRADRFGLAQMYQLRGRVGRSDRQAYAYLIIARESGLSRTARKRLKVLMSHSDLGSGFQIAMHDLKIRGGGTILGAAQSGHIAAVGYDMFLKLMKDAVTKLKGETTIDPLEPEINLPLAAYIPEDYMPDIDQRLTTYRRLARMTALEDVSSFKRELKDRFGELPDEAVSLLIKIMLRILAIRAGVKRLDLTEKQLTLYLSTPHLKNPAGIVDWVTHID